MSGATLPETAPRRAPSRETLRTIGVLVLFLAAVVGGVVIHSVFSTPAAPANRFPAMDTGAAEPQVTAKITAAIAANDPQALAASYSAELLQAFQEAMAPVTEIEEIHYAGGVERAGETLASYVVTGKDQQGQSMVSGFVVHVQDNQISGFN